MIPRTIHRVWLGDAPIPDVFESYWERWGALHPDWTLRTWRDDDLDWLTNREVFENCHNLSECSDVARFEILATRGGFYVDVDVEPLRSIEALAHHDALAGWEFSHRLGTAVLGATAGHPAFTALVDRMPAYVEEHDQETSEKRTGPVFLTTVWWKRTDVTRLPREAFYPIGWFEKEKLGGPYPPDSYACHHWSGSWVTA